MAETYTIRLLDIVIALASAVDVASPATGLHHKRVAILAARLGEDLSWDPADLRNLVIAATLHDLGAPMFADKSDSMLFEMLNPHSHAELSYSLLSKFLPLNAAARSIRYHHANWLKGAGAKANGQDVPLAAHLLHLADGIDLSRLRMGGSKVTHTEVVQAIALEMGRSYAEEWLPALHHLQDDLEFWRNLESPDLVQLLSKHIGEIDLAISIEDMRQLAVLLARITNFRSSFTSVHAMVTGAAAHEMAMIADLEPHFRQVIEIGGILDSFGRQGSPNHITSARGNSGRREVFNNASTEALRRAFGETGYLKQCCPWLLGTGEDAVSDRSHGTQPVHMIHLASALSTQLAGSNARQNIDLSQIEATLRQRSVGVPSNPHIESLYQHLDMVVQAATKARETEQQALAQMISAANSVTLIPG